MQPPASAARLRAAVLLLAAVGLVPAAAVDLELVPDTVRVGPDGKRIAADRFSGDSPLLSVEDDRAVLRCARGGYASLRAVVRNAGSKTFRLTVGGVKGVQVDLYREWYIQRRKTWFADPLIPFQSGEAFTLPAGDNGVPDQRAQSFWVDVWVPAKAREAGFALSVDAGGERARLTISLVHDGVVYPAEDAITADHNTYGIGFVGGAHPRVRRKVTGDWQTSDPCFRLIQAYHRMFYDHRGAFHQLGYNHSGGTNRAFAPELVGDGAARKIKSWDAFDRHFGPLLDGSAFRGSRRGARPIEGMYLTINPEWPARYFHWGAPDYEAEFVNVVSSMEKHFRKKGWTHTGFEMFFNHKKRYKGFGWDGDETRFPKDDAYFRKFGAWLEKSVPAGSKVNIRFRHDASWRMRSQIDTLAGVVNHWVLSGGISTMYPEIPKICKDRGDLIWIYGGTSSIFGPVTEINEMPMRAWLMGMDGYERWQTISGRSRLPNSNFSGTTCILYSGDALGIDGPIPSVRLKIERNVLQDIALLRAVDRKIGMDRVREKVSAFYGLKPADFYRPNAPLRKKVPQDWSNADLGGPNRGKGLFSNVRPDGAIMEKVRAYAFQAYQDNNLKIRGQKAVPFRPPTSPLEGYRSGAVAAKSPAPTADGRRDLAAALKKIAEQCRKTISSEDAAKLVTPRARKWIFKKHPRDRYFASDNYDVDLDRFDRLKVLLRRIAHRNRSFPVDCNLWLTLDETGDAVHLAIRQVNGLAQFYRFGQLYRKPEREMRAVLETGRPQTVDRGGNRVSVYVPVLHQGRVIGWIEACARPSDYAARPSVWPARE